MNHPDARIQSLLTWLASAKLPAIDLSLDRVRALCAALGNPQDALPPVVHVAGTNGKGSLLAYLTAMLSAAGYRVHRYTSPHLVRFNERIILAGKEIGDDYLLTLLERIAAHIPDRDVTFFEATTAAAFAAFAETPADIVLLETGLGGRLDATNLVRTPLLTAITPVAMDHREYLGNTLTAISAEKAGIIKQGIACVVGPQEAQAMEVIAHIAGDRQAPLYGFGRQWQVEAIASGLHYHSHAKDIRLPKPNLTGEHQIFNAGTAIACAEHLQDFTLRDDHIAQGILHADWPARLQHLTQGALVAMLPPHAELWLDGGHNPQAGEVLARWVDAQSKPVHLICGMLKNKETNKFLRPLAVCARSLTAVIIEGEPQSQTPEAITALARAAGFQNAKAALSNNMKNIIQDIAKQQKDEFIILICGSLYLAGNILWQNNHSL